MFTFKKEPRETGLARIANPHPFTTIKHKKKDVGSIYPPTRFNGGSWTIGLTIKKEGGGFKWIFFKKKFLEEADARKWLNERAEQIVKKYDLYIEG